jgi:hypothetical protein
MHRAGRLGAQHYSSPLAGSVIVSHFGHRTTASGCFTTCAVIWHFGQRTRPLTHLDINSTHSLMVITLRNGQHMRDVRRVFRYQPSQGQDVF